MLKAIEAVTDRNGMLRFLSPTKLPKSRRVIITILDDEDDQGSDEMTDPFDATVASLALLSESALAKDWERPEEDEAWSHLAQLPSL